MVKPALYVLASGGIDSTTLLYFYKSNNERPKVIHFQYNQPNNISEKQSIEAICKYYDLECSTYNLDFPILKNKYELYGRNALFILSSASIVGGPSRISLGIHSYTGYYDCSPKFIITMQDLLDGYFAGTVQIETPFINYSKKEIIKYAKNNEVPLHLTYSCLNKNAPPGGICLSCKDRVKYLEYQ